MEGGWEHTISSCLHPVSIKGMRIDRHNELVRMVRDAILHSKKGNTKVYADLNATRHGQYPPQVTDEECDFRPLANADQDQESNTVLLNGAAGPN